MKNIQIIDKSFGQIIAELPMLDDLLEDITEQSLIENAWDIAVEKGLVDENYRENYDMEIVGDIPLEQSSA